MEYEEGEFIVLVSWLLNVHYRQRRRLEMVCWRCWKVW